MASPMATRLSASRSWVRSKWMCSPPSSESVLMEGSIAELKKFVSSACTALGSMEAPPLCCDSEDPREDRVL